MYQLRYQGQPTLQRLFIQSNGNGPGKKVSMNLGNTEALLFVNESKTVKIGFKFKDKFCNSSLTNKYKFMNQIFMVMLHLRLVLYCIYLLHISALLMNK